MLPEDYTDAYLCHVLNITYTELVQQPDEWVHQMMDILNVKSKIEEQEMKKQQSKMRR